MSHTLNVWGAVIGLVAAVAWVMSALSTVPFLVWGQVAKSNLIQILPDRFRTPRMRDVGPLVELDSGVLNSRLCGSSVGRGDAKLPPSNWDNIRRARNPKGLAGLCALAARGLIPIGQGGDAGGHEVLASRR